MNLKTAHILRTLVLCTVVLTGSFQVFAGHGNPAPHHNSTDTTRYPLIDRRGDPYSYPGSNSFDLRDTSFIKRTIEYDPKTNQYYIIEKIGNKYYRTPTSFSMDEFLRMQGRKDEEEYFRNVPHF